MDAGVFTHTLQVCTDSEGYSTIITQMQTGKIGFSHLLYLTKVPGFNDPNAHAEITIKKLQNILEECFLYYDLQLTTWSGKRKRARVGH